MSKNTEKINKLSYLHSGTGAKNREKLTMAIGYVLGNMGSLIAIKNEYKEQKINSLNKEILAKLNQIREGNAQLADIKQQIADKLTELAELKNKAGIYREHIRMLNETKADLNANIARFHTVSLSDETVASELLLICEGLKINIGRFLSTQTLIKGLLAKAAAASTFYPSLKVIRIEETEREIKANSDYNRIEGIEEIHKSSIINFYFSLT
jgi:hypothetical protein